MIVDPCPLNISDRADTLGQVVLDWFTPAQWGCRVECQKSFACRWIEFMRIGIFGGSFDPIHHGHLILAENCREQANLDQVCLLYTSDAADE